jgi:hypothetical protein
MLAGCNPAPLRLAPEIACYWVIDACFNQRVVQWLAAQACHVLTTSVCLSQYSLTIQQVGLAREGLISATAVEQNTAIAAHSRKQCS